MSLRLQIFIGIIILILLLFVANMVRNKKIDLRYALSWLCLGILLLILDIFPQIVFWLASLMGVEVPSNMVFFMCTILAIVLIYVLTVSVSRLSNKTKRLTQEVALLREEMERLKK